MNALRLVLEGLPLALVSVPRRELAAFCEQLARASPRVAELVQGLAHLPCFVVLAHLEAVHEALDRSHHFYLARSGGTGVRAWVLQGGCG